MSNYINRLYPFQKLKLLRRALKPTQPIPKPTLKLTDGIEQVERLLSQMAQAQLEFQLECKPSKIPNAGQGVFLKGKRQEKGKVISFYPGTVYLAHDPILFVSIANEYILKCQDGLCVDGKSQGLSGRVYRSIYKRENWPGAIQVSDESWMDLNKLNNPLAVGQYVNNGTDHFKANVCYHEIDLPIDFSMELRKYIPNMYWNTSVANHETMRIVGLVALEDIFPGQELYSTYMDIIE